MRTLLLSIAIGSCAIAHAQNWALLNPTYKYNYSNDGSDTISNQIFVTHIDTLGVDSFRYELNRIGVVCDTCPASLGGPCDGCFVWADQPQFLGLDCIRSGSNWYFNAADTFMINGSSSIGSSWMFNPHAGTTALVDDEWAATVFGTPDTLQRILLSDGDTILLSRSFGIIHFSSGAGFDLIGVEGAGVGHLLPDLLAYFDYQPGDELTYKVVCVYWCSPPSENPYPHEAFHYWQAAITGRSETTDTLEYTTSVARTYAHPGPYCLEAYCPNWPMPLDHWMFSRTALREDHTILTAYPGEVLDRTICGGPWPPSFPRYIAKYGISPEGRGVMYSQRLGQAFGYPTSGFALDQELAPDLFPFNQQITTNVWYEVGIGIWAVEYDEPPSPYTGRSVQLVGAIIGGDTIIQPPEIEWDVAVPEEMRAEYSVHPNPAVNSLLIDFPSSQKARWRIMDISGKQVGTGQILGQASHPIDVSALAEGVYVLVLATDEGQSTQRFVIAR